MVRQAKPKDPTVEEPASEDVLNKDGLKPNEPVTAEQIRAANMARKSK